MSDTNTKKRAADEDDEDLYEEDATDEEDEEDSGGRGWVRLLALVVVAALIFVGGLAAGALYMRHKDRQNTVLATIGGTEITKDDLFHRMDVVDGANVMHQIANEILQHQFAQQLGVLPSETDIDAKIKVAKSQPTYNQNLFKTRQTDDDIRRQIEINLTQNNIITKGVSVTDAEVQSFYQANLNPSNANSRFYIPPTATVAVIVTDNPQDIQQAYTNLKQGQPFDTVVRLYSKDASKDHGGVLPPLQMGRIKFNQAPGLENAVFRLKPGQLSTPQQFGRAWWIIRCLDLKPAMRIPFDSVKDECVLGAKLYKGLLNNGKQTEAAFEKFQQSADVKVYWPQYTEAVTPKRPDLAK